MSLSALKRISFLKSNRRGQALIEYMIVISLVSITAVAVLRSLSTHIQNQIRKTTHNIQNLSKKSISSPDDTLTNTENVPSIPY